MDVKLKALLAASILLLLCGSPHAAMSVFVDSGGNIVPPIPPKSVAVRAESISRYGLPEGCELLSNIDYEFYLVSGKTFSEIMRSVDDNGPFNKVGTKRLPYKCEWRLGVVFDFTASYGIDEENAKVHVELEVSDLRTEDRITVTLPALLDSTFLNPVEKKIWDQYMLRLIGQAHDIANILRNKAAGRKAASGILETTYLIFDFREGMDVERYIESYLRQELEKAASDWARDRGARVAEYENVTAHGMKHEGREKFLKENR